MKINKQISLITLIIGILISPLALGMNPTLTPKPFTNQLPTPGVYQIESSKNPGWTSLIYVSETTLREFGPEAFKGLRRVAGPIEMAQEPTSGKNEVGIEERLALLNWAKKHYSVEQYNLIYWAK